MELTEKMVIDHLGQPEKKQNSEYIWMCPCCQDKSHDNLKYNPNKNILYCFADANHSKIILSEIFKKNQPEKIQPQGIKQWEINREEYHIYQDECNNALMASDNALNYLYEHRLINPITVKQAGLGYDFEDNKWVIPVYRHFDMKLVGFEYRGADFTNKQVWKEKDSPSCLCRVWGKGRELYIVEGMLDGAILAQWMDYPDDITIISPTMGVSSLPKVISEIILGNYDNIYLMLDNDESGQKVTKELLSKYDMIDKTPTGEGIKDITDKYREFMNDR